MSLTLFDGSRVRGDDKRTNSKRLHTSTETEVDGEG